VLKASKVKKKMKKRVLKVRRKEETLCSALPPIWPLLSTNHRPCCVYICTLGSGEGGLCLQVTVNGTTIPLPLNKYNVTLAEKTRALWATAKFSSVCTCVYLGGGLFAGNGEWVHYPSASQQAHSDSGRGDQGPLGDCQTS